MHYVFGLVVVCVASAGLICAVSGSDETASCEYWNDPHLRPFRTKPNEIQRQYLCRSNCTEVLIRNQFLEIFVASDPNGDEYPIIEYTMIFFPTEKYPIPCVITDSIANPSQLPLTCPEGSSASSLSNSPTRHYFHSSENIKVDITYRGNRFNFLITQSFDLIAQSAGVCVKWDCDLEYPPPRRDKRQTESVSSMLSQICDIYINAALKQTGDNIDKNFVESHRVACEYDLKTSLDPRYAQSVVASILRESVSKYENDENFKKYLLKMDSIEPEIVAQADQTANKLIESSHPVCKDGDVEEKEDQRHCLQPIHTTG